MSFTYGLKWIPFHNLICMSLPIAIRFSRSRSDNQLSQTNCILPVAEVLYTFFCNELLPPDDNERKHGNLLQPWWHSNKETIKPGHTVSTVLLGGKQLAQNTPDWAGEFCLDYFFKHTSTWLKNDIKMAIIDCRQVKKKWTGFTVCLISVHSFQRRILIAYIHKWCWQYTVDDSMSPSRVILIEGESMWMSK